MLKSKVRFFFVFTMFLVQNSCFSQLSSISDIPPNSPPIIGTDSMNSGIPNPSSSVSATSENNFSPSVSSASASTGSFSQPLHQSANSSPLEKFVSAYTTAIQSSEVISDAYDLSETSLQSYEEFLHKTFHSLSMSLGISDHQEVHSYATLPIVENFEVLTYPVLSRIGATAMGKTLLAEGILNDTNAASLASALADVHETSAKRTVDNNFQESKFQALLDGYVGFLKAQGLLTSEKFPTTLKYIRDEISLAGKQFGNFEQPTSNLPPRNSFSPSLSSTSASTGSRAQPPHHSANSSPLETFISTYTKAVHSSAVLSNLFDISQTSLESYENYLHKAIHSLSKSVGISDHQAIHSYATVPVVENFEVLTYPVLTKIGANAMGKHLLAEGILNDTNAASLASAFADEYKKSAKQIVDKHIQESKFQALVDGYVKFLKSQGLFTPEQIPAAGKYFRDEFSLAGKQFGRKSLPLYIS